MNEFGRRNHASRIVAFEYTCGLRDIITLRLSPLEAPSSTDPEPSKSEPSHSRRPQIEGVLSALAVTEFLTGLFG